MELCHLFECSSHVRILYYDLTMLVYVLAVGVVGVDTCSHLGRGWWVEILLLTLKGWLCISSSLGWC